MSSGQVSADSTPASCDILDSSLKHLSGSRPVQIRMAFLLQNQLSTEMREMKKITHFSCTTRTGTW